MPLIFYSVTEARARMEVISGRPYTRQAVVKAISSGKLRSNRIGEMLVVTEEALMEYVSRWARGKAQL